jgi:hypothetical protein
MLVTDCVIVKEARPTQPEKVESLIEVIVVGNVKDVKEEQPENAEAPMVVIDSGNVMEVIVEQPENADAAISFIGRCLYDGLMFTVVDDPVYPVMM